MAAARYYGTGRRKSSVARVYLVPGSGKITVNKRDIEEYFGLETLKLIIRQPLEVTGTTGKFDISINVCGGGTTVRLVLSDTVFQELYLKLIQISDQL